jgi:hypothetical protein
MEAIDGSHSFVAVGRISGVFPRRKRDWRRRKRPRKPLDLGYSLGMAATTMIRIRKPTTEVRALYLKCVLPKRNPRFAKQYPGVGTMRRRRLGGRD